MATQCRNTPKLSSWTREVFPARDVTERRSRRSSLTEDAGGCRAANFVVTVGVFGPGVELIRKVIRRAADPDALHQSRTVPGARAVRMQANALGGAR